MSSSFRVRAFSFLAVAMLFTGQLPAQGPSSKPPVSLDPIVIQPTSLDQDAGPPSSRDEVLDILEQQNARLSALEAQNSALQQRINRGPRVDARGGWETGVGLYFLQPHFDDMTAMTIIQTVNRGGTTTINTSEKLLGFGFSLTPKVWAAYSTDDGWMFRGDYMRFDATDVLDSHVSFGTTNSSTRVVIPSIAAASDDVLTGGFGIPRQGVMVVDSSAAGWSLMKIDSRVLFDVVDLDALRKLEMLGCQVRLGGGARFAHLDQTFNAYAATQIGTGGNINQRMDLENSFQGGGLQAILELRRAFGQFGIYGNARGGILFGQTIQDERFRVLAVNAAGATAIQTGFERDHTSFDSVPFVDLEAGFDWRGEFGPVAPFATLGIVGQQWFGVGSPTQTANNKSGDLGLFGLQISAGLDF